MQDSALSFLGTRYPLLQAPMAGAQGSNLALAVARAGGLGALPCAMLGPELLQQELQALTSSLPEGVPYNLNFFCHHPSTVTPLQLHTWQQTLQPWYQEFKLGAPSLTGSRPSHRCFDSSIAALVAPFRPPIVSFHFGLPSPDLVTEVKSWGSKILVTATTLDEAIWLADRGADAIIAQGLEAGGHRGHFLSDDLSRQMGTFALLPQLVRVLQPRGIPVIAAGGIASPDLVQAALQLGASAVQVGTAYLCANEARTSAIHRNMLQSPRARHTSITTIFSGRPARSITNRIIRETAVWAHQVPPFPHASAAMIPIRTAAEAQGSGEFSPLWCGQNATGCHSASATDITHWLMGQGAEP